MSITASLHTFDPLDSIVRDPAIRKAFLIVVALVALVLSVTGYAIIAWRQRTA